MYGGRFKQSYGWHIRQAWLRHGFWPNTLRYLEGLVPLNLMDAARGVEDVRDRRDTALDASVAMFMREVSARKRAGLRGLDGFADARAREHFLRGFVLARGGEFADFAPVAAEARELERQYQKAFRKFSNIFENEVRTEFGHRKVGEGWVSEVMVAQLVGQVFPEEEILRHHRPDWLGGLEIDVYVPGQRLGVEYQGQQHYHPIKAWGGRRALLATQERDERKARLCRERLTE